MNKQSYGNGDAWFGAEDTPAPEDVIADPAPKLTIAIAAKHRNAKVLVRYRRPTTHWQSLETRRSHKTQQAQYYTTQFPRTEPGIRVEYEVLVRLPGTSGQSEQRVGEIVAFEVATKAKVGEQGRTARLAAGAIVDEVAKTASSNTVTKPGDAGFSGMAKPNPEEFKDKNAAEQSESDSSAGQTKAEPLFRLDSRAKKRLNSLKRPLGSSKVNEKLDGLFEKAEGNFSRLNKQLEESSDFDEPTVRQIKFANDLAELTEDDETVVDAFLAHNKTRSLRDIALNLKKDDFKAIIYRTGKEEDKTREIHDRLFRMAPNHVIHRMTRDKELDLDEPVRSGLLTFFEANPELDFRKESVLKVLNQPDALKSVPETHRDKVTKSIKSFQRLSAISPRAEALPKLMKVGLDSAYAINEVPQERFVALYSDALGGEDVAKIIHAQAQKINIRNEHALIALREAVLSPSINMVHHGQSVGDRKNEFEVAVNQHGIPINYETLFGSVDLCECQHCNSVYSPAAYLVELFQYLRNNNLDPDNPNTGEEGIIGTPLQMFFRRRPDLGNLQMTCENTNTLIPYIDLVNEVMESFVANLNYYAESPLNPKKTRITAYNVIDESSGELLAEPQHTNNNAYKTLQKAVYPVCKLPYHQPIDTIRHYLNFLNTSRYELLKTFRMDVSFEPQGNASAAEINRLARLEELQILSVDRAIAAEYPGMTEEEYVILTKESFHTREWYELEEQTTLTQAQYREKIGLKETWDYYGIETENKMLNELKWVKPAQTTGMVGFLRRVNMQYVELIELLKTRYINPNYLSGRALAYMNSLDYSYRYLQTLVDNTQPHIKLKYQRLVQFLQDDLKAGIDRRFDSAYVECWGIQIFCQDRQADSVGECFNLQVY